MSDRADSVIEYLDRCGEPVAFMEFVGVRVSSEARKAFRQAADLVDDPVIASYHARRGHGLLSEYGSWCAQAEQVFGRTNG